MWVKRKTQILFEIGCIASDVACCTVAELIIRHCPQMLKQIPVWVFGYRDDVTCVISL